MIRICSFILLFREVLLSEGFEEFIPAVFQNNLHFIRHFYPCIKDLLIKSHELPLELLSHFKPLLLEHLIQSVLVYVLFKFVFSDELCVFICYKSGSLEVIFKGLYFFFDSVELEGDFFFLFNHLIFKLQFSILNSCVNLREFFCKTLTLFVLK